MNEWYSEGYFLFFKIYNLLKIESNLSKKKTMELKMKCIEMEALYETYTPQVLNIIVAEESFIKLG